MSQKKVYLLSLLFLLLPVMVTAAETLIVPSSGIRTISRAIVQARPGDTVLVEDGTYKESIYIKDDLTVIARNKGKVVIDAGGHGIGVTLGAGCTLSGIVVKNATIGIFNKSAGSSVEHCSIQQNWLTGVMSVRYLPSLTDNTIVFNKSSGIVIWDARSTNTAIEHNTIAYNVGFGIVLGGTSEIAVQNNTIAFNQKYALDISNESQVSTIKYNNLYENLHQFFDYPVDNYSFDPQFSSPRVLMNFAPNERCCAIRSSNNENLGVRFTN